jgi:chromosome segregation ATPase
VQELRCSVSAWEVQAHETQEAEKKASHDLQCTQHLLTDTRATLVETQTRETNLQDKVKKTKQESAKLQESLEEERQSKHEAIEEAQESLEATRQVLNSKWEKEMEQLRENMNQLLEEERQAYRNQAEEAEEKYQELDTKFKKEYAELSERSISSVQHSRQEAQERLELVQSEHQAEIQKIKTEADESKDSLIRKGRTMINEAKAKAKKELQTLDDECMALEAKLAKLTKEKQDTEHQLRTKVASLKQKIDFSTNQINDLTRDGDEFQEKVKTMEREKFKLQEDNDRYRRQLGGRYGADGKAKAQLEKLQREYNAMLEENRNIKKQSRNGAGNSLASIGESDPSEEGSHGYSRGGVNRTTLSQMRQEYEEQLEGLNDEKRELIMKNSAASTDVQKAEQRAWEREQEVAKLKSEITSLQLAHQRAEFSMDRSMDVGREKELSFFSAHDEERSPGYNVGGQQGTPDKSPAYDRLRSAGKHTSPGISRALQQKRERENALLGQLSSMTGSPNRQLRSPDLIALNTNITAAESTHQVLTPTKKYNNEANKRKHSPNAKLAADVYGLQSGDKVSRPSASTSTGTSASASNHQPKTLMDYTQVDEPRADSDERPECNQS